MVWLDVGSHISKLATQLVLLKCCHRNIASDESERDRNRITSKTAGIKHKLVSVKPEKRVKKKVSWKLFIQNYSVKPKSRYYIHIICIKLAVTGFCVCSLNQILAELWQPTDSQTQPAEINYSPNELRFFVLCRNNLLKIHRQHSAT